jgi:hypothetical protein
VFIIQGSVHDSHALMAANAEQAAVGVLLQPWSSKPQAGSGCQCCAADSDASADMGDARTLAAANTLRSLNPHVQVSNTLLRGRNPCLCMVSKAPNCCRCLCAASLHQYLKKHLKHFAEGRIGCACSAAAVCCARPLQHLGAAVHISVTMHSHPAASPCAHLCAALHLLQLFVELGRYLRC